jgi:AraC family transcriptional regulator of adaptative response/methylated-DNA-[protein]-cysteine methyltransferase
MTQPTTLTPDAVPAPALAALDPEACWRAVLAREPAADGQFVYAVLSTGVYCRPTCPSRRPRRERVRFFAGPGAAAGAGYRACLRCRPEEAPSAVVERACRYIEAHLDDPIDLETLGLQVDLSPSHLQRVFKRATGISPREYADAQRLSRFRDGIAEGEPVTRALYEAGYGSASRLYERAADQLGMSPGRYRGGAAGVRITYAVAPCVFGTLLAAGTEKGLCAVSLGDSPSELETRLRQEFHAAEIERDDERLAEWLAVLLRHLEGREPNLDLPLDIRATAFQRLVWNHLRTIPYGHTASYSEVAEAIGRPSAARAVAAACAANPAALVIPCHRVVRTGGALSGYRWGTDRKSAILEREASSVPAPFSPEALEPAPRARPGRTASG